MKKIGEGAAGEVFGAVENASGEKVAIKKMELSAQVAHYFISLK